MKRKTASGAYVVEFAIVVTVFLIVLLGLIDFARLLFLWNSLAEATRVGARTAVVCKHNSNLVTQRMTGIASIGSDNIRTIWFDTKGNANPNCYSANTSDTCAAVEVSITGVSFSPISPIGWIGFNTIDALSSRTYLTREMMGLDVSVPDAGCPY